MHLNEVVFFAETAVRCHLKYDKDTPQHPVSFYITSKGGYYEAPRVALHMSEEAFRQFKESILEQLEAVEQLKKEGEKCH